MIRLYDMYQETAKDLDFSLQVSGVDSPVIVINDNGFLPKGATSPYAYFCGINDQSQGTALYFNQVQVPEFWEITGNANQGEVFYYNQKKANIYYAHPKNQRLVQTVDWLDQSGKVRYTDHYNQYGWRFAQTSFSSNEEIIQKTYYNKNQQEVIVENIKTGGILLSFEDKLYTFKGRSDFIIFFLKHMEYDLSSILLNSLSTPLIVSLNLQEKGKDVLFWQESLHNELPGNMQFILNNPSQRIKKIVIHEKETYQRALDLAPEDKQHYFVYLPYLYPKISSKKNINECLILTNSDQIEGLEMLLNELPDRTFHIAALTEMSQKLMKYQFRDNVHLYPNVTTQIVEQLLRQCSVYLDINYGSEIFSGVRQAYEHQLKIFAFNETVHQQRFVQPDHLFSRHQLDEMVKAIKSFTVEQQQALQQHRQEEDNKTIDSYRAFFK